MRLEVLAKHLPILFLAALILRVILVGYEFTLANLLPMPKISSSTTVVALFGDAKGDRPGPQTLERVAAAEAIARKSGKNTIMLVGGNRGNPGEACAFLNRQRAVTGAVTCAGQSYSTRSNLLEITSINDLPHDSSVALITSKAHSYRVRYLCYRLKIRCSVHATQSPFLPTVALSAWVREITAMTAEVLMGSYADRLIARLRLDTRR